MGPYNEVCREIESKLTKELEVFSEGVKKIVEDKLEFPRGECDRACAVYSGIVSGLAGHDVYGIRLALPDLRTEYLKLGAKVIEKAKRSVNEGTNVKVVDIKRDDFLFGRVDWSTKREVKVMDTKTSDVANETTSPGR